MQREWVIELELSTLVLAKEADIIFFAALVVCTIQYQTDLSVHIARLTPVVHPWLDHSAIHSSCTHTVRFIFCSCLRDVARVESDFLVIWHAFMSVSRRYIPGLYKLAYCQEMSLYLNKKCGWWYWHVGSPWLAVPWYLPPVFCTGCQYSAEKIQNCRLNRMTFIQPSSSVLTALLRWTRQWQLGHVGFRTLNLLLSKLTA